ncbi:hypothetical protein BE04_17905 [Sorangium cellulosum]|uniref:Secreted protein n=1 Tax=Sorangium cellulosum TaxID=56 RepID=A0A150QAW4_SORCE|nr:hypothetical protein BE04_17905 [Sorangium cellulosum]
MNRVARGTLARRLGATISLWALALAAAGCFWTVGGESEHLYGHSVVHVEAAPADIYAYPSVRYRGGYAYLVGETWYYEGPRGWVIFRSEPRVLAERRVVIRSRRERPHHHHPPRYYEERRAPAYREPVERRRRYYAD